MHRKKSIGFVIHSLNAGGAERVVTSLANHLVQNYKVTIICLINCDSFYELDPNIELLSCEIQAYKNKSKLATVSNHIRTVKQISKYINNEPIDLIIGFTTSVNVLAILASRLSKKPIIISERNNSVVRPPNYFWRFMRNAVYRFADYLVVQTSANKKFFTKIVSDEKILVIKNPISSKLAQKRAEAKQKKITNSIVTVGRLDANKSQDLLIRAFSNIPDKNGWHINIIGNGNKMKEYRALAISQNIEDSVFFLGNVVNVEQYYNNADIFVFTSRSEGFPNALAEALYFGIPSISTNCPHGPSDLIKHNHNGVLIEVDNQKELENELKRLMMNVNLRDKLRNNALKMSKELDINIIASTWKNYITKTLEKSHS